jgi:lipid-A-disaccharide synthase
VDFVGVGGPQMASAGCELLETTTGRAAMIYNAFTQVGRYYRLIRRISQFLSKSNIDLVIVCDSPAFNFHVAKAARKAGIKTLFYVAPQLWAWAEWRIRKLRRCCDKLCCILPFEQQWFGQRGVDTVFVGNPLLDDLPADLSIYRKDYADFDPTGAHFALLPGSRPAEINSLWRPMQRIALRLRRMYPDVTFVTVAADEQRKQTLQSALIEGLHCDYTIGNVTEAAGNADFAIVASGSATLQVAAVGCPMVVMYQSSRILWHLIGRWLIKSRHLSLVNILSDKDLVPEFMPYFASIDPIVESIDRLLRARDSLPQLSRELVRLAQPLHKAKASQKTAQIVREMLD